MCGIVGFVNRPGQPADRAIVERMTATLAHRGPDGEGFYCEGPAALGHRRLSIIDVAGGSQPMSNEDDTVWITYNGELYNELELRKELLAKGHTYRTSCDTESLIHLYEEEGIDFARRLNGMFAAAIWDSRRRRLVLVRDRMGQKPLFYGELPDGGLAFGSEPKALLAHPAIGRTLDHASLVRYLFYEYVPAPHSIWQSIHKLPRGHVLCWEDGKLNVSSYWDAHRLNPLGLNFEAAAGRFWNQFRDAVSRHRRSDVPDRRFSLGRDRLLECRRGPLRDRAGLGASTRSRSGSKTRASMKAAMPAPSPITSEPIITSRRSRSRPSISCCRRSQAGSMSLSAMPRFCRPTC